MSFHASVWLHAARALLRSYGAASGHVGPKPFPGAAPRRLRFGHSSTNNRNGGQYGYYQFAGTSVYKGYKQDKIEMRGDRAEMSDFPLYLNTVAGGLDRRDQTIGGFSFVVKIYALPVVEIIG